MASGYDRLLLAIPYAGGNAYNMEGLLRALDGVDVFSMELPGRGRRVREPMLSTMDDIVSDLYEKAIPFLRQYREYYIFGHSMGALTGYLLIRRLMKAGWRPPAHFFVSGTGGPSAVVGKKGRHLLPSSEFRKMLKELGGTPEEVLSNPDIMDFFEPIIRADFAALESFNYEEMTPMDIPLTGFFGSEEETSLREMFLWQKESSYPVDIVELKGDHFFIFSHWQAIGAKIKKTIGLL